MTPCADDNSSTPAADRDRLPSRLSPSAAKQYLNCPLAFKRKYIERRPTKNTVKNTQGTLAHAALEEMFRLPREERTPENAHEFVEPAWDELKEKKSYQGMVEPGSKDEADMLAYARDMVSNYFGIENPQAFDAGALEYHAEAELGGLSLHGYIDRLDKAPIPGLEGDRYLVSDYKALALDTPIPTPTGWTTMSKVQPGDPVLGRDGAPTHVINKSRVHRGRACFEVGFDNGDNLIADEDHLWLIYFDQGRMCEVVTTLTLLERLEEFDDVHVPSADPLHLPYNQDLPVPPRALGEWLGDGAPDDDLFQLHPEFLAQVADTGRVPTDYLRAALEQRLALLQGLLSNLAVDGVSPCEITAQDPRMLEDIAELIASLGGYTTAGDDEHTLVIPMPATQVKARQVASIQSVESRDTQCIEVDAPDSLFLAGRSMIPTHNTGKIPSDRYLDDAFFAMRVYALLLFEETGEMPYMLRLIYLKKDNAQEAVRRALVTPEMLERTRRDIENIWTKIRTSATTGNWPTKTGPLCNFCDFKSICPAFGNSAEED